MIAAMPGTRPAETTSSPPTPCPKTSTKPSIESTPLRCALTCHKSGLSTAERRLGRPVEAAIRDPAWLESGTDAFHDTIASRPLLKLDLPHQ
jgi:hypothetical protein